MRGVAVRPVPAEAAVVTDPVISLSPDFLNVAPTDLESLIATFTISRATVFA